MTGRRFDEWRVDETIEHPIRRTVTETDNLLFSTLTHNPQPLHLNARLREQAGSDRSSSTPPSRLR